MKSVRWLVAPALLLGVSACGSDSGSASSDKWCDLARDLEADTGSVDDIDFTDPDSLKTGFADMADKLAAAVDAAPDEIKDAVETTKSSIDEMVALLEAADYNIADVDQEAFSAAGPEAEQASTEIEDYNERECGIEPTASEDTPVADDGTEAGTSDVTIAAGTQSEQIAAMLATLGLDEEQATCVAEKMDPALVAEAEANQAALFGVLEECGISLADLAEIGQNSGG